MGWEGRAETAKQYYYRSTRDADGTVIKNYYGRGHRPPAAAKEAARARADRQADREAVEEELGRIADSDASTRELDAAARLLMEATLLALGYHRQQYGQWRKRRGCNERTR